MQSLPKVLSLNRRVLAILSKCNHLNHLKQLQSFLITLGHSQTQFYAFKLVRFCVLRLSDLDYARFIFDHLYSPNIYLHAAMVTAYASLSHYDSAFALYCDMVRRGHPKANHFIFPHLLKSCKVTNLLHTHIVKSGFDRYLIVQTALLDSYSRSATDIGIARKLFDEMSEKSVVSWTAMISGYARIGEIESAMYLFNQIPERDVPSWNAVIAGCTQNGFFQEAISIFRKMLIHAQEPRHRHNKPNQVTVVCALSACGHIGMLQLGKWIHGYVYRNGLVSDSFVSNALVDMYGKCGSLGSSVKIFNSLIDRNLISWTTLISALGINGLAPKAVETFKEMECQGFRPDKVAFLAVLTACRHGALVREGIELFEKMDVYGIKTEMDHYHCIVDLLARHGHLRESEKIISRMPYPPNAIILRSFLEGCQIHRTAEDLAMASEHCIAKSVQ
uniref:Pentatricopeptide repeat-containing protein n=1 Tax=Rhizophora mucronata TaxID=61149 RepID=A0A2P2Q2U6_RHIMU